jgi:mono/diheme cytochrome c family protein
MRVSNLQLALTGASLVLIALIVLVIIRMPFVPRAVQVTGVPTLNIPIQVGAAPTVDQNDPLARGQTAYNTFCAHCHGYSGEGEKDSVDPSKPDKLGYMPVPRHDSKGHTWLHPDQLIIQAIRSGISNPLYRYQMPAVPEDKLSAQQVDDILAYIKQWWTEEQRKTQAQYTEQLRQARDSAK